MRSESLGVELFRRLFGIIITDKGSGFKNPIALETGLEGALGDNAFFLRSS